MQQQLCYYALHLAVTAVVVAAAAAAAAAAAMLAVKPTAKTKETLQITSFEAVFRLIGLQH